MGKKRKFKPWKKFKNHKQNPQNNPTVKCVECDIAFKPPFKPRENDNIFCKNYFTKLRQKISSK